MARVTVEDCVEKVPNRFNLVLLAATRARAIAAGSSLTIDRDNDKNPVVALREIAEDTVSPEELKECLISSLQRVDEHSEAEEEAETLALLADPTHAADERAGAGAGAAERPRRGTGGALLSPGQTASLDELEPSSAPPDAPPTRQGQAPRRRVSAPV